jgi:TolA-binding protein
MLKPKKRLTRREIKEDKFVTTYAKVSRYLEENSKFVLGAAAAVVVLVVAVYLIRAGRQAAEGKAAVELARGMAAYERLDLSTATDILRTAVEDYGGPKNGALALLHLGNALYDQGNYPEAMRCFEKAARKLRSIDFLAAAARAAQAQCLEQEKDYLRAARGYEDVAKRFAKDPYAARYLVEAGRCYVLAGRKDEAERVLTLMLSKYPDSLEKTQAQFLLGETRG